jgi:hypothetical protein
MCSLTMALTIGSTLLGAVGQVVAAEGQARQMEAQAKAADYNAQVVEMNATLSDRRAKDALERGAKEEQRKRLEVQRILGSQQAAMAANGVDITFGSPLDTLTDTAMLGEIDALTIRTNANRESYDRRVDAVNQRAGATLDRMEAQSAREGAGYTRTAGYLGAFGTVLTGAGKAFQGYRQSTIGAFA